MFRKKATDEGSNFWISYADLMAGLLFVFILLIGAIVSKSIILKSDLHDKEDRLAMLSSNLEHKEEKLGELSRSLMENKKLLKQKDQSLNENDQRIKEQLHTLKLKEDEIRKLNRMLLAANTQKDLLSNKIVIVQNLLKESNATLNKTRMSLEERNRMLAKYKGDIVVLSEQLSDVNQTVKEKDAKLLALLNALDEKETKYDALITDMQKQKAKIKSLTGIKLKVVAALKEALGDKIDIDKKSGSLRLSSNILFDKGSAVLKDEAKVQLKKAFEEYIGTLVTNPKIKPHLDKIIIEGHTDSDGGYLYNLDLSQRRAFAVMNYLLTLDFAKQYNIQPLMIASGRAYLDAIKVNGVEDKDASRRIEIKFRLKNEDAMHEIERVLDAE
ncbi:OmpA family protein [Sulfurovum riftiae]|uniref:OmpA-like domain-containing protein n=1 Tax=Sulfurovum riftiae TaxID=1630136 RepID=A0A151CIE7_9BACT|nr:OmpA family protein [Sulfurovum riftiae]KYJ87214.1 hypothetical protein AS592_11990 [Sulfurovum riftiae]